MNHDSKPIFRYPYKLKPFFVFFGILSIVGAALFVTYAGWKQSEPILIAIGIILFGLLLSFPTSSKSKKEILLYEDKVLIPYGFRHRKEFSVVFSEVASIDETSPNHILHMRILLKSGKTILINSNMMQEIQYYDLFDKLDLAIGKNEAYSWSPTEIAKASSNIVFLKTLSGLMPILFLFIKFLVNDRLETINDWIHFLEIAALIIGIEICALILAKHLTSKKMAQSKLSRLAQRRLKRKWEWTAYSPSIISMIFLFVLIQMPHEGSSDIWPFVIYSITATAPLLLLHQRILPNIKNIVSDIERWMASILNIIFVSIFLTFFFVSLNINLDTSVGIQKTSFLTEMTLTKKAPHDRCFKIAHWITGKGIAAGDSPICSSVYPQLAQNDKVAFILRSGFLGEPWLDKVVIEKYKNIETLIIALGQDLELKYADVDFFSKRAVPPSWDLYHSSWSSKCLSSEFQYCRLAFYISHLKNDEVSARKFILRGCQNNDFLSCYNIFPIKELQPYYSLAKNTILKSCNPPLKPKYHLMCEQVKQMATN